MPRWKVTEQIVGISKTCTKCGADKDLSEYHRDKSRKTGYTESCKDCKNAVIAKYIQSHRKEAAARARKYRADNYEEVVRKQKEYRDKNKEKINKRKSEAYKKLTKEQYRKMLDRQNRWNQENKEIIKERKMRRKILKLSNGIFNILPKEIKRLYNSECVFCKNKNDITLDHVIPLTRGGTHSVGNLQPLCKSCNSSKNNKLMIEWLVRKDKYAKVEGN